MVLFRYLKFTEMIGGCNDDNVLYNEIERLTGLLPSSENQEQRYDNNIEAIDSFLEIYGDLDLTGIDLSRGSQRPPKMTISNVEVSVWPEIILSRSDRNNEPKVGILKLYLSKTYPLDDLSGQYIATITYRYAAENLTELGTADYRLARVIDIFMGNVHTAPRNYRRRMQNVEAACHEIYALWPEI